jgi:uncharacterized protein YndB with AHSA1/START domain/DNA-binding transcriptional ArsR family regulator
MLDQTLAALADPTRRAILQRLSAGEARVTELARPFDISLNSVSKHIRMLERARLVRRRRVGREHLLTLNPTGLDEAADWIDAQRRLWASRLEHLDAILKVQAMTQPKTISVQVTHQFAATAAQVFDAWLDPQIARRFLFATATGEIVRAEVDTRVGGAFVFTDRRPDAGDIEHRGEYLEIDRPRRLVFRFVVTGAEDQPTKVQIDIRPLASGCELTLTHDGVPEDFAQRTEGGWAMILKGLAKALA